jgi:succinylarginine dihydrolase
MPVVELNIDGLVGPTHHYAGLSTGNVASTSNAYTPANPARAAHQGIEKMRLLHRLGLPQAFLPPSIRPNLTLLAQLGFEGAPQQQIQKAHNIAPSLLTACYSAASMWTANAATVSPSHDTLDGRVHFTAANLVNQLHRHQEAEFSSHLLRYLFADDRYFTHHAPLPKTMTLGDEGAANHSRLAKSHADPGVHLFVYGRHALHTGHSPAPKRFPARQTREASEINARRHQLPPEKVIFACQNPEAIDQGVFHHDVIGVANESVLLIHEDALVDQANILAQLQQKTEHALTILTIKRDQFTVQDAVESYLFNSQLITLPDNAGMLLLAPTECETHPKIKPWIDELIKQTHHPIHQVIYLDLKQSMRNGGGPACLRLRVPLHLHELAAMNSAFLVNDQLLDKLDAWVDEHYRTELHVDDLADPQLMNESYTALRELEHLLKCKNLYRFL